MAQENLYAAPKASLAELPIPVPDEILKKIKGGWIAALISAVITLGTTLIAMSGTEIVDSSAWNLIDVALILYLAFGIYKKSRTSAVCMLVFFVAIKVILMVETGQPIELVMGFVFAIFFWRAVAGTFAYHKFMKDAWDSPPCPGDDKA